MRRGCLYRSLLIHGLPCLAAVKKCEGDDHSDCQKEQDRFISRLSDTSVVHNAVIRGIVTATELFKRGLKTMNWSAIYPPITTMMKARMT